jgi:hypothetical protein
MDTLNRIRQEQQARYAVEREYRLAQDKLNNPKKLTIRQTQVLMNKYGFDKALVIAKRYNTIMKGI